MSPVCVVAFSSFMLTCLSPAHVASKNTMYSRLLRRRSLATLRFAPSSACVRLAIRYESLTLRSVCISRLGNSLLVASLVLRPSLRCSASNRSSSFHSYLLISSASHECYLLVFLVALVDYLRAFSLGLTLQGSLSLVALQAPAPSTPYRPSVCQRHQMLQSSISHSRQFSRSEVQGSRVLDMLATVDVLPSTLMYIVSVAEWYGVGFESRWLRALSVRLAPSSTQLWHTYPLPSSSLRLSSVRV